MVSVDAFHNRLNDIMLKKGLSVKDLSRISGVSYKTLTNIRAKKSLPDLNNYFKITNALGSDPREFWSEDFDTDLSVSDKKILESTIASLSSKQREIAFALINAVQSLEL